MRVVEGRAIVADIDEFLDDLGSIGDEHGCIVVPFDARYIAGREHVERAVSLARRATARGEAIAADPGIEVLLYAAGRRQIDDALTMGIGTGERDLVIVIESDWTRANGTTDELAAAESVTERLEPAATLDVEYADRELVCEFFGITDEELAATEASLEELVVERVALLTVDR